MEALTTPAPRTASAWADRAGTWASIACVIHCLFTPILLSFSAVLVHTLPSEERVHRGLAITVAVIGAVSLLRGFRKHRRTTIVALMCVGLGCISAAAWWGDLFPHHWMEVMTTFTGSGFMIAAHRMNHTFCGRCACSTELQVADLMNADR